MPRIVSLIPSATEIVAVLGFEDDLVGRSHECDFPTSVRQLPVCTEPKFDLDGTSYEIEQRVKAILQEAVSVYRVDADRLRQLRPDVIVTQAQCEVCAVSLQEVESVVCAWLDSKPQMVSLEATCLAEVWEDIGRVAEALGVPAEGADLVADLKQRISDIEAATRVLQECPSVVCIEWIEPLMAAGNWLPEQVEMAGGVNLFGTTGEHSSWMTWEALRDGNPDVIVMLPCGFDIERTRREMPALTERPGWLELKAVRNERVYLTDGNQFFNRPGPRLVESLEILAEVLHPGQFDFGHKGMGWEPFM